MTNQQPSDHPFQVHELPDQFWVLRPVTTEEILTMARQLIQARFSRGQAITSPNDTREFLMLQLATLEHEVFYCIFLDNQHKVLLAEACFQGTVDGANVYPREIVKRALQLNASAVILAHNHPSGLAEPSQADQLITHKLKDALALIEVRVLDHFVIGGTEFCSFAERGLL
ncbi:MULTISPECIES: RadC family protein [Methylomonas]|uniref:DNA repair protein n=1 Tax=Methylomonas koyamae TaxID=702114 RepID=A0A177PAA6_9GAMM|nr:DNA repair protein RadC [Methylomonas koyamae]OAI26383.1 DNA repair protein [Methylomonas koyamae]